MRVAARGTVELAAPETGKLARDRRFATTLARGLSVLRAFRADDDGLGNAELAARTGLPRSTVSRLTFTLRALGSLEHARGDERYRPGPVLLALGNVAAGAIPFVDAAAPPMQRLADDTGTLAVLGVRDGGKLLLVRTWRPRGVASLWLEVGHRVPILRSSSGHALLAALPDAALGRVIEVLTSHARRNGTEEGDGTDDVDASGAAGRSDATGAVEGTGTIESTGARRTLGERVALARRDASAQLDRSGFVIADPSTYFTPNIHAVAVPFHARQLAEPVVFACGATPADLSPERLHRDVGPALRASVDELARTTGQPGARRLREPEEDAP